MLIADFSSVLEIAFGLNALLVVFEIRPEVREFIRSKRIKESRDFDIDAGYAASMMEALYVGLLPLSTAMSIASLGLLIAAGFDPCLSVPTWMVVAGLPFLLLLTPAMACHAYWQMHTSPPDASAGDSTR